MTTIKLPISEFAVIEVWKSHNLGVLSWSNDYGEQFGIFNWNFILHFLGMTLDAWPIPSNCPVLCTTILTVPLPNQSATLLGKKWEKFCPFIRKTDFFSKCVFFTQIL